MPTPALATRLRSWFKREDRVGITERVEGLEKRVGDLEQSIKKLKDQQEGDSNPADNGSNDGNDNDGGTRDLTERMGALEDQSNIPHELQRRETQAYPSELEDLIKHNVERASQPFRGERSITIKDQEEDDSRTNEEGHHQHHNNIRYITGKNSATKDQGPSSQQQPASLHPSSSSPKPAIADAELQISSPEQLPSDRNRRDEDPDMHHWYAL